ncbi:Nitric oxide reductase cytochrome c subunit [Luteitalea pratensis]|uniref:Nitric oxide reductase cytochrome c subunit n=1 Tax=Luteitalea pratensis TaxID=1855912 RepID=A0A143PKY5_LUTPR|nr:c-type cytochrome [Luteitalea pratensis]AMY09215.1 Nitric oxide reductase cytochrome c subunit [Luteitalea pratensis]
MTKRHTRLFFVVGTSVFAAIFLGLTIHSHMRFGELTHAEAITPQVIAGKHVWHRKNCINCHTLLGEGAYYAPDLTKITQQRGEAYLRLFLRDPSRFYSEQRHGRVMPNMKLSDEQITDVIAFLTWVSNIDNQGWPPRPIVVSAALPDATAANAATAASGDPVALGEAVFRRSPPACFSCHSTTAGTVLVGPSMAGIATRAATLIADSSYKGAARSAPDYIRESILNPSAYVVPGPTFGAGGQSVMPPLGALLKPEEVEQLVAYLATFK